MKAAISKICLISNKLLAVDILLTHVKPATCTDKVLEIKPEAETTMSWSTQFGLSLFKK